MAWAWAASFSTAVEGADRRRVRVLYELDPAAGRRPLVHLAAVLLAQDFFYYWSHRGHHMIRCCGPRTWCTTRRSGSTCPPRCASPGPSSPAGSFYLPLIALGVHPAVVASAAINLLYQFWIHTERIDRMPRPVRGVFNTPSHHRVHHASQGGYLDRNFGGILIVWDRLFGSFAPETERCVYGLTKNVDTTTRCGWPSTSTRDRPRPRAAATWRHRVGHLFRGAGLAGPALPAVPADRDGQLRSLARQDAG